MNITNSLKTPVLLLAYNRPKLTRQVLNVVSKAKPEKLFVSIDGPKNSEDRKKVEAVCNLIEKVSWNCQISTRILQKNRGCKDAVSSGIDWFFEQVQEGIILEDDILPDPSFFFFCQKLLARYRDHPRIMHIGGEARIETVKYPYSYHFVRDAGIWGWATWRRAWKKYDIDMKSWPEARKNKVLEKLFPFQTKVRNFYYDIFEQGYKATSTWDHQWTYANIISDSFNIRPAKNLIKNIGFSDQATHTYKPKNYHPPRVKSISFPLEHPPFMVRDDKLHAQNLWQVVNESWLHRFIRSTGRNMPNTWMKKYSRAMWRKIRKILK